MVSSRSKTYKGRGVRHVMMKRAESSPEWPHCFRSFKRVAARKLPSWGMRGQKDAREIHAGYVETRPRLFTEVIGRHGP